MAGGWEWLADMRVMRLEHPKYWRPEEIQDLKAHYLRAESGPLDLRELAKKFGKLPSNVCRKARSLGLSRSGRRLVLQRKVRVRKYLTAEALSLARSEITKRRLAIRHPRGALGMKHTAEAKARIAKKSAAHWKSLSPQQKLDHTMKSNLGRRAKGTGAPKVRRGRWYAGWREIGAQRLYCRSRWEANYARYLEWLRGLGQIQAWQHECHTFWFENIKRGAVSYLPDFKVVESDGSHAWHEVKGWMDARSTTVLRRMGKYFPSERVIVIREKEYKQIRSGVSALIPDWEDDSRAKKKLTLSMGESVKNGAVQVTVT